MTTHPLQPDPVELTGLLVQHNTITPSPNEKDVLKIIGQALSAKGFCVTYDEYDDTLPGRCSLQARLHPQLDGPALCLAGHIDTVPLGSQEWSFDPFCGQIKDGFLLGRGSCDMKSGVAAIVCAALKMADKITDSDFVVQIYGGEELNCEGSAHLMLNKENHKNIAAVIVAEPTSAIPYLGHRGVLWLKLETKGKTAHASMPKQGDNALLKLLKGTQKLTDFSFTQSHEVLGRATFVLSSLVSGININSIPDSAYLTIDMRTVPSQDHKAVIQNIKNLIGDDITISTVADLSSLWTNPEDPFVKTVYSAYSLETRKEAKPLAVAFATDGASLRKAMPDCPIVILGPGDTTQAHQLNEKCEISQIRLCEKMYCSIIKDFYRL